MRPMTRGGGCSAIGRGCQVDGGPDGLGERDADDSHGELVKLIFRRAQFVHRDLHSPGQSLKAIKLVVFASSRVLQR